LNFGGDEDSCHLCVYHFNFIHTKTIISYAYRKISTPTAMIRNSEIYGTCLSYDIILRKRVLRE